MKVNYILLVVILLIGGIFIISYIFGGTQANPSEIDRFEKNILKENIEKIGLSTPYIPTVSIITLRNNSLFIEYFSYELGDTGVFNEQQKVAERIFLYFNEDEIQTPFEVTFRVNSITNENAIEYPTFNTKLNWSDIVKMANLELEYLSWSKSTNSTKINK